MSKPKDIIELRDRLLDAFDMVMADPRRAAQVKEAVNAAGKVIATCAAQMQFAAMKGHEPVIPFMGPTGGKVVSMSLKGPHKVINAANLIASNS